MVAISMKSMLFSLLVLAFAALATTATGLTAGAVPPEEIDADVRQLMEASGGEAALLMEIDGVEKVQVEDEQYRRDLQTEPSAAPTAAPTGSGESDSAPSMSRASVATAAAIAIVGVFGSLLVVA